MSSNSCTGCLTPCRAWIDLKSSLRWDEERSYNSHQSHANNSDMQYGVWWAHANNNNEHSTQNMWLDGCRWMSCYGVWLSALVFKWQCHVQLWDSEERRWCREMMDTEAAQCRTKFLTFTEIARTRPSSSLSMALMSSVCSSISWGL